MDAVQRVDTRQCGFAVLVGFGLPMEAVGGGRRPKSDAVRCWRRPRDSRVVRALEMDVDDFKQREIRKFKNRNEKPFDVADLDFWEPYPEGVFLEEFDFTFEATERVMATVRAANQRVLRPGSEQSPKVMTELRADTDLVLMKIAWESGFRYFLHADGKKMRNSVLAMGKSNIWVRNDKTMTYGQIRAAFALPCFEGIDEIFTEEQLIDLNRSVEKSNLYYRKRPEERTQNCVWLIPIRRFPDPWRLGIFFRFGKDDSEDSIVQLGHFLKNNCPFLECRGFSVLDGIDPHRIGQVRTRLADALSVNSEVVDIGASVRVTKDELGSIEHAPYLEAALAIPNVIIRIDPDIIYMPVPQVEPDFQRRRYWN